MELAPKQAGFSAERLARITDHLKRSYIDNGKIAGCQVLVARHGHPAYFASLGQMDRERGKPMRDDTIFRIYSMTKPITSVALMTLFERGVFQLADPVHDWIPEFGNLRVNRSGRYPNFMSEPLLRPVTIRDLLMHTSGLTYGFMERTNVDSAYRRVRIGD